MDSQSIDCIISSPPYWGLRDYGVEGQLGLEPDFRDYLKTMNDIMVQLKRVLKNTGTCWINLGDTYGYNSGKSRYGIPERFYINCIDDGWIARNHIPWYKANAMPSSVKDRFANKWESIFFFVKQQKYYFDLDSVREETLGGESKPFNIRVRDAKNGYLQQKFGEKYKASKKEIDNYDDDHITKKTRKMSDVGGQSTQGIHRNRKEGKADWESVGVIYDKSKPYAVVEREGIIYFRNLPSHDEIRKFLNNAKNVSKITVDRLEEIFDNYTPHHWFEKNGSFPTREDWIKVKGILNFDNTFDDQMTILYPKNAEKINDPKGKNPGDVFFINPRPFPEAHFATFPVDLPTKILKCACPKDGIVLDPFFGSGTVGVAAEKLGLKWCGIELNEEYIKISKKRLDQYKNESLEIFT